MGASDGSPPTGVRVGVDVGGTFTDLVAVADGRLVTAKVVSQPGDESLGVLNAIAASKLETTSIVGIAHGTTVPTNALLERRGARTPSSRPRASATSSRSAVRVDHPCTT